MNGAAKDIEKLDSKRLIRVGIHRSRNGNGQLVTDLIAAQPKVNQTLGGMPGPLSRRGSVERELSDVHGRLLVEHDLVYRRRHVVPHGE